MKFKFKEINKDEWPKDRPYENVLKVFKSIYFLVQIIQDKDFIRLCINRVDYSFKDGKPVWKDKISWDELQEIKDSIGYENSWCVECYPPRSQIVNVASMRHLWILDQPPEYGWHKE